jgi:replicative DNA helicase
MIEELQDTAVSAPDAEAALLACVIDNPEAYAPKMWQAEIDAEYFHCPVHSELYTVLSGRLRQGMPVDPASLREDVRKSRPEHLRVSGVADVINCEKSEGAWDGYVEALREARAQRLLQAATPSGGHPDANSGLERVREALQAAQQAISGSSSGSNSKQSVKIFANAFEEAQRGGVQGLETGIQTFDVNIGGMRDGQLWVIGAPTSGGKSVLMLQIAAHVIRNRKRVAIFSLEMDTREIMNRMISCTYGVSMSELTGVDPLTEKNVNKIEQAVPEMMSLDFHIFDESGMTMDHIAGHCCKLRDTGGLDLIVIDYIQQVTPSQAKGQSREQEVAGISRACKQLAKRIGCPVLTATQLNEGGSARESRAIENDADNVILISHFKDKDDNAKANAHLWKCRNGQRGIDFPCNLIGKHQRFDFE